MANSKQIQFYGIYFDGRSSQAQEVQCAIDHGQVKISSRAGLPYLNIPLEQCVLTAPLGSSRRFLKCAGGERLQVDEPAVLSFLDEHLCSHRGLRVVHLMESHWRLVATCMAGLVFCVWAFMVFAIPHLAKRVALATPAGLMDRISKDSLEILDKRFFTTSALAPGRQDEVQRIFRPLCEDFAPDQGCTLVVRKGGSIGANAFALPSGLVIVTDELVDFVESDDELAGVFAHELIHVKEHHGLRHVVQQAGVFMLISTLLGDMGSLTSLGSAMPMMLVESGYSRLFEQEADEMASLYFLEKGRSVKPYKEMLYRLTKDQDLPGVASFLASHPGAESRRQAIEEVERTYSH